MAENTELRHHILSVLVENRAGVLARIALLFSRRGFSIYSLAVAPTDDARFSRITIVVDVESSTLEQITKQLHKLVNVLKITELMPSAAVERELMLVTVNTPPAQRNEVLGLIEMLGGSVIDVGHNEMMLMVADSPDRLDAFEDLLRPYGIDQLQRTGRVALPSLDRQVTRLSVADRVS